MVAEVGDGVTDVSVADEVHVADHVTQAMPGHRTGVVTGAMALPVRATCIEEALRDPARLGVQETAEVACAG